MTGWDEPCTQRCATGQEILEGLEARLGPGLRVPIAPALPKGGSSGVSAHFGALLLLSSLQL